MTDEQLAKLPKWAQQEFKSLSIYHSQAVKALNAFCDEQTPGPISIEDHPCTGEKRGPSFKKKYIQARSVRFEYEGVTLEVQLSDGHQHDKGLLLRWGMSEDRLMGHVAFIPLSFQCAEIVANRNMRER